MGKGVKVLIVGLPLFAERLQKQLERFDKEGTYINLNTYYNRWHRIKAFFTISKVDIVFSINGNNTTSRLFDRALKKNKVLIMNWVGSDVTRAVATYKKGEANETYMKDAVHFCEVNWIQDELKDANIDAEICNFVSFDRRFEARNPGNERLKVLSYISESRADFYGANEFIRLAEAFPNVDFVVAGSELNEYQLPDNLKALGWVENMGAVYHQVDVCVRYPEHDGLSSFILESLARGKHTLYKYPFNQCMHCPEEDNLHKAIEALNHLHVQKVLQPHTDGMKFIEEGFNTKTILGNLVAKFKSLRDA